MNDSQKPDHSHRSLEKISQLRYLVHCYLASRVSAYPAVANVSFAIVHLEIGDGRGSIRG